MKAAATAAVTGKLKTRRGGILIDVINSTYGRKLAAKRMRAETAKKAPVEHYPAPHALIDLWETHGGNPQDMQKAEIASFARLLVTDTSRNLVRVFFLREKLKSLADGDWSGKRVHVIGAGAMGGDIAAWCAWHGFTVTLADMKAEPLGKAIERAADLFGKIGHKSIDTRDALDRLIPDLTGEGVRTADLVIEAVPETLELKRKVYAATEPKMRPGAILATNTSSIPLQELRVGLQRPDHLVGLHFFNPVSRMQLVEVVSHDEVSPDVLAKGARVHRAHRPPARAGEERAGLPGQPRAHAVHARSHGDAARGHQARDHRRRGRSVRHADGADRACRHRRARHLPARGRDAQERARPADARRVADAADKVEMGQLGRKTGKGFYDWRKGEPVKERDAPKPTEEMTDRLILPMLDVCVACLREGVVADEDTVDGAMIFATGFAPFRGGPMHYARSRGAANIRAELERLAQRYGERFRPDPGWDRLT